LPVFKNNVGSSFLIHRRKKNLVRCSEK